MVRDLFIKADLELVEEVKNGNVSAFSELVKRHQKGLFRLCLRFLKAAEVADDVLQETFIKAYQKIHTFEGRSSFKSWIYQIGVNTAKNKLREYKYNTDDIENVNLGVGATSDQGLNQMALSQILDMGIDSLPPKQKTALMLRIYDDMSFKEIAEIMECPYDTAKANYRHALIKLKDFFNSNKDLKAYIEDTPSMFVHFNNLVCEAEA